MNTSQPQRLTDEQIARIAALLRPHLPLIREAQQPRRQPA